MMYLLLHYGCPLTQQVVIKWRPINLEQLFFNRTICVGKYTFRQKKEKWTTQILHHFVKEVVKNFNAAYGGGLEYLRNLNNFDVKL